MTIITEPWRGSHQVISGEVQHIAQVRQQAMYAASQRHSDRFSKGKPTYLSTKRSVY